MISYSTRMRSILPIAIIAAVTFLTMQQQQCCAFQSAHIIPKETNTINVRSVHDPITLTNKRKRSLLAKDMLVFPSDVLLAASETEAWVRPVSNVLDPFLNFMSFAMLSRVVISWYPELLTTTSSSSSSKSTSTVPSIQQDETVTTATMKTASATSTDDDGNDDSTTVGEAAKTTPDPEKPKLPIWISFIVLPTQPLLTSVKGFIPSAFGVDITPIFWLAIFTFIHEILLGQQGLLTMKIRYGI